VLIDSPKGVDFAMSLRLLLFFMTFARLAFAQEDDERPDSDIREPERQRPRLDRFAITVVDYNHAVRNRDIFNLAIPELIRFFGESTDIEVQLDWNVRPLFDERVQDALMLYMTGQDAKVRLSELERKALGTYLRHGGFLFAEDVLSGGTATEPPQGAGVAGTPFDQQFKRLMRDPLVLGGYGGRWLPIPETHPLYFNYFDFGDGPPLSGAAGGNVFTLEMLEYRGRVAVVFSDLNLSWYWATRDAESRDRPLQLGVNLVVQALANRFAGQPLPTRR